MSKEGFSVILIDFVFKLGKIFYPKLSLSECKHVVKENEMSKFINDELEICSDESDYSDTSDEKNV